MSPQKRKSSHHMTKSKRVLKTAHNHRTGEARRPRGLGFQNQWRSESKVLDPCEMEMGFMPHAHLTLHKPRAFKGLISQAKGRLRKNKQTKWKTPRWKRKMAKKLGCLSLVWNGDSTLKKGVPEFLTMDLKFLLSP